MSSLIDYMRQLFTTGKQQQDTGADNNGSQSNELADSQKSKRLIHSIVFSDEQEIGCDDCYELLDRYTDLALAGEDVAQLLPHIDKHLAGCRDCREEYEALTAAVEHMR